MGTIEIKYQPIKREAVKEAILCDFNDVDYRKFMERMKEKSQQQKRKRREKRLTFYLQHKDAFDDFFKLYSFFTEEKVKDVVTMPITPYCKWCANSHQDKYRNNPQALVCWFNKNYGSRPRKIMANDIEPCSNGFKLSYKAIIPITDAVNERIIVTGKGVNNAVWNIKRGEIANARLRLAWESSKLSSIMKESRIIHSFSVGWLVAFIRDIKGDEINHGFSIGKDALKYEHEVRGQLFDAGFESLPRLIKFYYQTEAEPHFKIIDAHVKYGDTFFVLEVFTFWRKIINKVRQVKDYCYLVNLANSNNPIPILICESAVEEWGFDENQRYGVIGKNEGKHVGAGVQVYSIRGFVNNVIKY